MSLASDIAELSKSHPLPKVETSVEKDYSQEVFESIINYIKAECLGFGSVVIMLDTVKDNFGIVEHERTNYSATQLMNLLKQDGFTLEIVHDYTDAIDVQITWHQELPPKPYVKYADKWKAVYTPVV